MPLKCNGCWLYIFCVAFFSGHAQIQPLLTYDGRVFFTSLKDMYVLEAFSERMLAKYTPKENKIKMRVQITSFNFTNCSKSVEKIFNDLYMESHKYHWAEFTGSFSDTIPWSKEGEYSIRVQGILKIKNTPKPIETQAQVKVGAKSLKMESRFSVKLSDYQIQILNNDLHWLSDKIDINVVATFPFQPTLTPNK